MFTPQLLTHMFWDFFFLFSHLLSNMSHGFKLKATWTQKIIKKENQISCFHCVYSTSHCTLLR